MPHSVSSETSPRPEEEDGVLPDAPSDAADTPAQTDDQSSTEKDDESQKEIEKIKQEVKLEDLFNDDDDDDDEFATPGSTPDSKMEVDSSPPEAPQQNVKFSDPETMYAFYQRLFPFRYLFQWLNHGVKPAPDFAHREFAFTLQNDAYLRYQSFPTADLLRKDILRLQPSRFEIGPQYSTNPRDRKSLRKASAFRPIAKELVFDIDLTDYDEIRTCCTGADICAKCWTFATMAIKVVDAALREDFGFAHILWVYSGRRGAHAWICDKKARELEDDKRKAIAGYLEVIKGGSSSGKKVNVKRPLHPHLARSLEILKPYFQHSILEDQDPFLSTAQSERLLSLLPDKPLADALRRKWDSSPNRPSTLKWADIDTLASTGAGSKSLDTKALREAKQDIVLEYTYPRLDVEVSKKLIHLLKSPFVVHPKTGRVCVPIDISKVEKFDPLSVPTVTELLAEIDTYDGERGLEGEPKSEPNGEIKVEDGEEKKMPDYEKTGLKGYVEYFERFVRGLVREEGRGKREREEGAADAMEF